MSAYPGVTLPRALADPDRLTEALVDPVGNAVTSTPPRTVTVTVTVRTRLDGPLVRDFLKDKASAYPRG
jgi:signal transduction histidine kinase